MKTRVYPTAGRVIRDPLTGAKVPEEGQEVDLSEIYWLRRLNDGDITTDAPKGADKAAKPAAKK
jgi:hypothetical protein